MQREPWSQSPSYSQVFPVGARFTGTSSSPLPESRPRLQVPSTHEVLNRAGTKSAFLAELIKLIVQVLDDVLRLNRGEFFFRHMTAVAQPLFQRIQRPNESVLAGVDGSIVASHAVSIMQALPVGAVARQWRRKRSASAGSIAIRPECFSWFASDVWSRCVTCWRPMPKLSHSITLSLSPWRVEESCFPPEASPAP